MNAYQRNKRRVLNHFYSQKRKFNGGKKEKLKFKSAFKIFKLDNIAEVKKDHPEYGFKERMACLKSKWSKLKANEKFLYVKRSRLDK